MTEQTKPDPTAGLFGNANTQGGQKPDTENKQTAPNPPVPTAATQQPVQGSADGLGSPQHPDTTQTKGDPLAAQTKPQGDPSPGPDNPNVRAAIGNVSPGQAGPQASLSAGKGSPLPRHSVQERAVMAMSGKQPEGAGAGQQPSFINLRIVATDQNGNDIPAGALVTVRESFTGVGWDHTDEARITSQGTVVQLRKGQRMIVECVGDL